MRQPDGLVGIEGDFFAGAGGAGAGEQVDERLRSVQFGEVTVEHEVFPNIGNIADASDDLVAVG